MSGGLGMGMSDDFGYLFESPAPPERINWFGMIPRDLVEAHDREIRAEAVMGFATHYLPHALWVKAKQYADDIREGR